MGSWQTHAAPLAAATRWIIVGVPGNKQVSWAAPGADEGHERTENICHGCHPKVNWGPPLPCHLQLTDKTFVSVSPLFTIDVLLPSWIETSPSLLFSMTSFSWLTCCEGAAFVPERPHHDASCDHNHTLLLRCSFPHKLLFHVSKEFCLLPRMSRFEYTEYVRITSTLVLCSVRWPGRIFFYSILVKSAEVQECKNSLQMTF